MSDIFTSSLGAFAVAALIIEITPGPNMGYLAILSLSRGAGVGIAAVAGVAIGHAVYGITAALGAAAIIDASPLLYELLRWLGVAYMLWLAYEAWSSEQETSPTVTEQADQRQVRVAFRQGLITNLLNPKAALFFVSVVPNFIIPGGNVTTQMLVFSTIFVVIATAVHTAIVLMASRLEGYANDPAWRRPIRRGLAIVLALIAVWLGISTAR